MLSLQSDAKTKCYNVKDCNPLYIHLPEKKKKFLKVTPSPKKKKNPHATFFFNFRTKVNDEKANNFKSHLSVGFLTRNYTCLA